MESYDCLSTLQRENLVSFELFFGCVEGLRFQTETYARAHIVMNS